MALDLTKRPFWVGSPIGFSSDIFTLRLSATTEVVDTIDINAKTLTKRFGSTNGNTVLNKRLYVSPTQDVNGVDLYTITAAPMVVTPNAATVTDLPTVREIFSTRSTNLAAEANRRHLELSYAAAGKNVKFSGGGIYPDLAVGTIAAAIADQFRYGDPSFFMWNGPVSIHRMYPLLPGKTFNPRRCVTSRIWSSVAGAYGPAYWYDIVAVQSFGEGGTTGGNVNAAVPDVVALDPATVMVADMFGITASAESSHFYFPKIQGARPIGGMYVHGWHDSIHSIVVSDTAELRYGLFHLSGAQVALLLRSMAKRTDELVSAQLESYAVTAAALVDHDVRILLLPEVPGDIDIYHSTAIRNALSSGAEESDIDAYITGGKSCGAWRQEINSAGWRSRILTWLVPKAVPPLGTVRYVSRTSGVWSYVPAITDGADVVFTTQQNFADVCAAGGITASDGLAEFEVQTGKSIQYVDEYTSFKRDLRREIDDPWTDPILCYWKAFASRNWEPIGTAIATSLLESKQWFI